MNCNSNNDVVYRSKSIDALIELCAGAEQCYAVGNYRNKKATFNDPPSALAANSVKSANFNSGVMVVPYETTLPLHVSSSFFRQLEDRWYLYFAHPIHGIERRTPSVCHFSSR